MLSLDHGLHYQLISFCRDYIHAPTPESIKVISLIYRLGKGVFPHDQVYPRCKNIIYHHHL